MKRYTAPAFDRKIISLCSSWIYCKESFAETFETLYRAGTFCVSGSGEKIWETRNKYVHKVPLESGGSIVCKGFRRIPRPHVYMLRPSQCGFEALNYQRIADLGIPLPEFLAVGEVRRGFLLKDAFFVTRFAEGFLDGRSFMPGAPQADDGALKEEFLSRHLTLLARCHDAGIFHRGFTPANIMWKMRSAPDSEGNKLDLLWIDLASCRRLPLFSAAKCCAKDISMCLKPLELPLSQRDSLIELYCSSRQKKAPGSKTLKALLG